MTLTPCVSLILHIGEDTLRRKQSKGKKEMECNTGYLQVAVVFFLLFLATSMVSANFISNEDFLSYGNGGRHLLQERKPCSMVFEFLDYTNITTQCEGPRYPREKCCPAFKKVLCPYRDYINDETTNCANTMYSYLNAKGPYPPGLFANTCTDEKEGIDCAGYPDKSDNTSAAAAAAWTASCSWFLGFFLLHCYGWFS